MTRMRLVGAVLVAVGGVVVAHAIGNPSEYAAYIGLAGEILGAVGGVLAGRPRR